MEEKRNAMNNGKERSEKLKISFFIYFFFVRSFVRSFSRLVFMCIVK